MATVIIGPENRSCTMVSSLLPLKFALRGDVFLRCRCDYCNGSASTPTKSVAVSFAAGLGPRPSLKASSHTTNTDTITTDAPIDFRSRMRISCLLPPNARQRIYFRQPARTKTAKWHHYHQGLGPCPAD